MSRGGVDDYLRGRNIVFRKDERKASADITKIGAESPPWYCDDEDIYISFQYGGDSLSAISIDHRLGRCL
jgi:hypothetical protein